MNVLVIWRLKYRLHNAYNGQRQHLNQPTNKQKYRQTNKAPRLIIYLFKSKDVLVRMQAPQTLLRTNAKRLTSGDLTLSLLWSISNFLCSLTTNITSHSTKNLAFHRLLRLKMITLPILITSLIHFSLKVRENVLFELGTDRWTSGKMLTHYVLAQWSF